jgi:hypothetical protein
MKTGRCWTPFIGAIGTVFDSAGNVGAIRVSETRVGCCQYREPGDLARNFVSSPVFLARVIRERLDRGW